MGIENHETLPSTTYNQNATSYENNNGFSQIQDGSLQPTETSRLITSGQSTYVKMFELSKTEGSYP